MYQNCNLLLLVKYFSNSISVASCFLKVQSFTLKIDKIIVFNIISEIEHALQYNIEYATLSTKVKGGLLGSLLLLGYWQFGEAK